MTTVTKKERGLGGAVEAALNHCMGNDTWLQAMANDPAIKWTTQDHVYQVLEEYICEVLAQKTNNQ